MKVPILGLLIVAFTTSPSTNAHSHTPISFGGLQNPLDAITMTGVSTVMITVGNLNNFPQAYEVYVDDEKIGTTTEVPPGLFRKLPIPVKLNKPNTPEIHTVCSVSVARENDMFRSKICTEAKLYWKM
ncbi:hypothetical protein NVP2275O_139 [Vibrio phage 2.275.O._10N.286.54.E11]|nr:hypothetical protein NVP2275O_139 [Vibrio phage 2.275.O._10N.286.54.E11]